jgi:hypothetical protein
MPKIGVKIKIVAAYFEKRGVNEEGGAQWQN